VRGADKAGLTADQPLWTRWIEPPVV